MQRVAKVLLDKPAPVRFPICDFVCRSARQSSSIFVAMVLTVTCAYAKPQSLMRISDASDSNVASPDAISAATQDSSSPSSSMASPDAVSAATGSPAPLENSSNAAAVSPIVDQIDKWESEFFSQHYTGEPDSKRIGRLEQLVFGALQKGTDQDRIDKLKDALNHQPDDSTAPPAKPPVSAAPTAPNSPVQTNPVAGYVSAKGQSSIYANPGPDLNPVRPAELTVTKKTFNTVLKPQRVISNLSEAIRDNPKDSELMFQRGKAYLQTDNLQHALMDFGDAITFQPNRSDFYLARAYVYHLMGNSVLSDLDLKQAEFVDPKFPAKVEWGQ